MPELVVDERGRTSLTRVRSHDYDRYLVEEFPDGTLVLTPAVTISAVELAALRDPVVRSAIAAAKSGDRSEMRRRPRRRAGLSAEAEANRVDGSDLTTMARSDAIMAVLKKADRPMRIPEILDALHEAGRTSERNTDVGDYLSTLEKKQRVVRVDRGVYTLPG
jgi:hypothetical protein